MPCPLKVVIHSGELMQRAVTLSKNLIALYSMRVLKRTEFRRSALLVSALILLEWGCRGAEQWHGSGERVLVCVRGRG